MIGFLLKLIWKVFCFCIVIDIIYFICKVLLTIFILFMNFLGLFPPIQASNIYQKFEAWNRDRIIQEDREKYNSYDPEREARECEKESKEYEKRLEREEYEKLRYEEVERQKRVWEGRERQREYEEQQRREREEYDRRRYDDYY